MQVTHASWNMALRAAAGSMGPAGLVMKRESVVKVQSWKTSSLKCWIRRCTASWYAGVMSVVGRKMVEPPAACGGAAAAARSGCCVVWNQSNLMRE